MARSKHRKKKPNKASKPSRKVENAVKASSPPTFSLPRPDTNTRIQLTGVPTFAPNHPKALIPRSPEGSKGIYRVTFLLSVPGKNIFRENLPLHNIMETGDSLLFVGQGENLRADVWNDTEKAEIWFNSNAQGRIATAEIRVEANSFVEAERYAYDLVIPQLSYWSYLYNVAVDIGGYKVLEEETDSIKFSFAMLGAVKPFNKEVNTISQPEYRRFFAAYREGMNATNVFYQSLSFYKVIEGIRALRKRVARKNKLALAVYPSERFPSDINSLPTEELREFAKPYVGQDYETVFDTFTELVRNAIAHLSQLDAVLDIDRFNDMETCLKAIPILKHMAHHMLENDLEALPTSSPPP